MTVRQTGGFRTRPPRDNSVAFLVLIQQFTSRVFRTRWGGLSCSPDPGTEKCLQNRVKTLDCYLISA